MIILGQSSVINDPGQDRSLALHPWQDIISNRLHHRSITPRCLGHEVMQGLIVAGSEDLPDLPIKDQDDLEIRAAAMGAQAQVLVTGDRELQGLRSLGKVRIVSPRAFWEELTAPLSEAPGVL
jgi:predicted nucleic acid-binding protein